MHLPTKQIFVNLNCIEIESAVSNKIHDNAVAFKAIFVLTWSDESLLCELVPGGKSATLEALRTISAGLMSRAPGMLEFLLD